MNCTKCMAKILKGEKYHKTRKGPHHAQCPIDKKIVAKVSEIIRGRDLEGTK